MRCGGVPVLVIWCGSAPDFWGRGPGFESGISHNDPGRWKQNLGGPQGEDYPPLLSSLYLANNLMQPVVYRRWTDWRPTVSWSCTRRPHSAVRTIRSGSPPNQVRNFFQTGFPASRNRNRNILFLISYSTNKGYSYDRQWLIMWVQNQLSVTEPGLFLPEPEFQTGLDVDLDICTVPVYNPVKCKFKNNN